MESWFGDVWLVRLLCQRGLAALYLVAFIVARNQFKPLLGEHGLLPAPRFLKSVRFRTHPSLFHWNYSDRLLEVVAWTGILLAVLALLGISEAGPIWVSLGVWLVLWALYLSIVNVGQEFYAFGWESMLLEAGFLAAFLGPARIAPSVIPILALRWMLFRTEIGAGLIKLRHDRCWRDLTCLFYHYETQPLPNPTSWWFHRLPRFFHRNAVLFSHFVQIVAPFGLFGPQPVSSIAGGLIIFHQLWLIVSGNYSWLNWLTVVLGVSAFGDTALRWMPLAVPPLAARPEWFSVLLYGLAVVVVALSVQPVLNLFSRNQLMNYSYNPLHLINTYGAFGSVTKVRYEIVIEGTLDRVISPKTEWQEYEFKGKPGNPRRRPPQIAPYHLRLDWLVWFLPFSVAVTHRGINFSGYEEWFMRFVEKLLMGDAATLRLLRRNPFGATPPGFIRASFYCYRYTTWEERRATGVWWNRVFMDTYLPPVTRL